MARAKGFYIKSDLTDAIKKAVGDVGKYDGETQKRLKNAIREGTRELLRASKRKARVGETGNLVKGIEMEYDEKNNRGFVKSTAHHSCLLEYGVNPSFAVPKERKVLKFKGVFSRYALIPARKARPFMKPALDETEPKIIKALKEAVEP